MKYSRFLVYLVPHWRKGILILFLTLVTSVLSLANPFVAKLVIDKAFAAKDINLFLFLIVIMGGVFVIISAIYAFTNYLSRSVELKVNFELKRQVFKRLQKAPYLILQNYTTAKHLYNSAYDIDYVTHLVSNIIPQLILSVPKLVFIFCLVFYLEKKIALLFLLASPCIYLIYIFSAQLLRRKIQVWTENSQRNFEDAQQLLLRNQLIRTFGTGQREIRLYIGGLIKTLRIGVSNSRINIVASILPSILQRVVIGLLVIYGGFEVFKGAMTLGTLSAIALCLGQLAGFQNLLTSSFYHITLGLVSCERLEAVLDLPVEKINEQTKTLQFNKGTIEFKSVSFSYETSKDVLKDISFCIEGGSFVALVGPSGCGKTTIVNLITRLLRPHQGEILIDNSDIYTVHPNSFFSQIGAVLQEPLLWNDTIFNNIRYGKNDAAETEVHRAAKIACINEFAERLNQGYATVIGENACRLSEGQKQRVAIARAVIKKPKILIIDEGFSSVDAQTETAIIKHIRDFLPDSTIIIISHRLSTISMMDKVYFLDARGSIEVGTHQSLLERHSQYQSYLARQAKQ